MARRRKPHIEWAQFSAAVLLLGLRRPFFLHSGHVCLEVPNEDTRRVNFLIRRGFRASIVVDVVGRHLFYRIGRWRFWGLPKQDATNTADGYHAMPNRAPSKFHPDDPDGNW